MKVVIILAALIALGNGAATICPMVVCDSSLTDMCYSATNTADTLEIKLKSCTTTQYCNASNFINPTNGATATCATYTEPTASKDMYPGFDCTQASECASGTCGDNGCTGLADKATGCLAWAMTSTGADKMCGAGLYCKSGTCATGEDTDGDCTTSTNCNGRDACIGGKCIALNSIAKGEACVADYYCASNLYCKAGVCADAVEYTPGSYGALCTADTDCGGDCECGYVNPDGKGNCGTLTTGGYGKSAINTTRTSIASSSYNCPLAASKLTYGGCAGTYTLPTLATQNTQSCYKNFRVAGGAMLPQPGSSAVGLYASVLGFAAYLLA